MTATKSIKALNDEAHALLLEAKSIYDLGDEATPEQLDEAGTKTADAEKISDLLAKHARPEGLKTANRIENTLAILNKPDRPLMGGGGPNGSPSHRDAVESVKSAGEEFVEAAAIKAWLDMIAPGGNAPSKLTGDSPSVEVKTLFTSAVDVAASRPMLGQADRRMDVVPLRWPELTLRQLITNSTTNTSLVEVVRELARENNAAAVLEATATSGAVGVKPESGLTWEVIQAQVQTIAHWVPATTRILEDARRLRTEIDTFLREGIDQEVEDLILNGNGTDPNFRGVYATTGILTQALVGGDNLTTTRKARTKIKVTGHAMPTAWLFHPNNWEDIDLTFDAEQRYYFGGPTVMGTPRLWGLPVVESEFATENLGLLADWRDAVMYDREQTSIRVGPQHADFFIRNMVAILAEMRAAFHVRRPASFVAVTLATHV
jgi:HK97 family phage major capsid protein